MNAGHRGTARARFGSTGSIAPLLLVAACLALPFWPAGCGTDDSGQTPPDDVTLEGEDGPEAEARSAVTIHNERDAHLYVNFTRHDHRDGNIKWGRGCVKQHPHGAMIHPGKTCHATVAANSPSTRFCASEHGVPADCYDAQTHHLTMVETNFETASNPGCFGKGRCVWYDISLIPAGCTDPAWKKDRCRGTGGASYNLPVSLGCGPETIYTCRGPTGTKWGHEGYPDHCGNPDATCVASQIPHINHQKCVNAYFYPMFCGDSCHSQYQPNTVCLGGKALVIRFLKGE